jgi:hypothetical protein
MIAVRSGWVRGDGPAAHDRNLDLAGRLRGERASNPRKRVAKRGQDGLSTRIEYLKVPEYVHPAD